jgi:hypothetical protein
VVQRITDEGGAAMATNEVIGTTEEDRGWIGPELPSLGRIALGTLLFATGGMLLLTIIGTPLGIVLLPVGVGMLTTPKERGR